MLTPAPDAIARPSAPAAARPCAPARSAAVLVAAGILLSRIAGLARDRIFAHYLGNSAAAGAFKAALRIPNFLQNLFGEGVLSASFIPVYSRLLARGEHELAARVAGAVASILLAAVTTLVALGVVFTPAFVDLVAPGFHGELRALTIHLVRVLFPGVGLLVGSAWCLGILNSHRRFFISYAAPIFWNLAMIATLLVGGRTRSGDELAVALAWGSVGGSLLQFGVQLPFVAGVSRGIRLRLGRGLEPVRAIFRHLGPVVLSRGVVQLSAYIDGMIASFLGAGAVAGLAYAQTLYLLPIGLFGMSVAAAELPAMATALSQTESEETRYGSLRARIQAGKRNIAFFVIPSVVAFVFLGRFLVAALYRTGRFGEGDTLYVWYILMGSVVGLLAATWGRLYASAFYALEDPKTPLRFAALRVALTAVLGVAFAFPLRPWISAFLTEGVRLPLPDLPGIDLALGAVGLTASAGLAGWIEYALLARRLRARIGDTRLPRLYALKIWAIALPAAGAALAFDRGFVRGLAREVPTVLFGYDFRPLTLLGVYGVAFLLLAVAAGVPEADRLLGRLRVPAKFRRRPR